MVKGKSVEETIDGLSQKEKVIVKRLRQLVKECLPTAEEMGYYGVGVPFYKRHRMICFIWPPSVYMGKRNLSRDEKGVTLGFCQGHLMSNDNHILLKEDRKQVYCMYFKSLEEIDDQQIRALLFEAEMIDQEFKKKK